MTTLRFLIPAFFIGSLLTACSQSAPVTTISPPDYDTAPLNLSTPEHTAYSMMIAMYRGDVDMIDQIFTESGTLQRVKADGSIELNGLSPWRDRVGTFKVGQAHEELFNIKAQTFGTLATVWAPFTIRFDGNLVGCGVNHFSMSQQNGQWRIISGMDVQAPKEDCDDFQQSYKAAQ